MATEAEARMGDMEPQAELVDCLPDDPSQVVKVVASAPIEASPVRQAMEATIAQTGADPPPTGDR